MLDDHLDRSKSMWEPSIFVVVALASLGVAYHAAAQPPTTPHFYARVCDSNHGNYMNSSNYGSNLEAVLQIVTSQASSQSSGNCSVGTGGDKVFGQYYCRGDVSVKLCSYCIAAAAGSIGSQCSTFKAAVMWYEECTLRYSDVSMQGVEAELPGAFSWSKNANVTDPDRFGAVVNATRDRVVQTAAYENVSLHFATGEGVVSPSETVYMLAQCSPDLSGAQCETCIRSGYDKIIAAGHWAAYKLVFYSSCQIRYTVQGAFYPLHNAPPVSPLSPPQPVATATRPPPPNEKGSSYYVTRAVIPSAVVGLLIVLGVAFCLFKRNRVLSSKSSNPPTILLGGKGATKDGVEDSEFQNTDCIQFDLKTIKAATNTFSDSNKLGRGGFGIVYQGTLEGGQDIAVKRLSKNSGQGAREFKTEVAVLAKLQHKNLVRLVGFCIDGEERLLVYEFLRNLSLDCFLYDAIRSAYLTWAVRYNIIFGIARGLHYLHEDSRVKIVHRDLKISNILLDDNLDPKIADFGLAKLVEVDETSNNTTKVIGTFGYMSPEYALAGRYSTKSDVYSFGVIILEILSGKVNSQFYETSQGEGLISYAWGVWNEGAVEKLIDPVIQNEYSRIEAERCLQIGLLCVQDDVSNRPPMHVILVMLNSNNVEIPPPLSTSHSNYINKLSLGDTTQEGTSKQHQNDFIKSSTTYSLNEADKDIHAR